MKIFFVVLGLAGLALIFAQPPTMPDPDRPRMKRSQVEEILKADYVKSLEDASKLVQLSEELKIELEKSNQNVLSMTALKKAEEIEKIAKRIRGRMKRF